MEIQRRPIRFGQWVGMPARSSLCFSMKENGIPTVCPRAVTVTMEPMVGTPSGLVSARSDRATYSPPCTELSGVFREVSQKQFFGDCSPLELPSGHRGFRPVERTDRVRLRRLRPKRISQPPALQVGQGGPSPVELQSVVCRLRPTRQTRPRDRPGFGLVAG